MVRDCSRKSQIDAASRNVHINKLRNSVDESIYVNTELKARPVDDGPGFSDG